MKSQHKHGFTIIEVVLVLTIAGLIFMMVFIGFPALQRAQRDTQRRTQMANLITQIVQYQANNHNRLPAKSEWNNEFRQNYLLAGNDTFTDPDGNNYTLKAESCGSSSSKAGDKCTSDGYSSFKEQKYRVRVITKSNCDGEKPVYNPGAQRVSVVYKLEGGGTVCVNN